MRLKKVITISSVLFLGQTSLNAAEPTPSNSIAYRSIEAMNYNYGIFVVAPLPKTDVTKLKLSEINKQISAQSAFKKAVSSAAQTNMIKIGNLISSAFGTPEQKSQMDFRQEITELGAAYLATLKASLAANKLTTAEELRFQLMIAPKPVAKLAGNQNGVPLAYGYYPQDRLHMVTPYEESLTAGEEALNVSVYQGIQQTLSFYNGVIARPFFVSALFDVTIREATVSNFNAQLTLGMPTSVEFPFLNPSPQISFYKIATPEGDQSKDVKQFPVITVDLNFDTARDAAKTMTIEFGPLGSFANGRWNRAVKGIDNKALTPSLVGHPIVAGKVLPHADVNFHIRKIELDASTKSLAAIDLLTSGQIAGLAFPVAVKISAVDKMFAAEINKTITTQKITAEETVQEEINKYAPALGNVMKPYLDRIFSIDPNESVSRAGEGQ